MNLTNEELKSLIIDVAKESYGTRKFRRRKLMLAVEQYVREIGKWTPSDDMLSGSKGRKSEGLAKIDWAISHLKEEARLFKTGYDEWRVPYKGKTWSFSGTTAALKAASSNLRQQ